MKRTFSDDVLEKCKTPKVGLSMPAELAKSMRFSYVRYDSEAAKLQEEFKAAFEAVEEISGKLNESRAKSLFLTHLEIAYMWTGKAIRDEQISRDAAVAHEPSRTNE